MWHVHMGDRRWGMYCVWGTEDAACTVYGEQKMGNLLCMGDRRWGIYCVWGTEEVYTEFWRRDLKERYHL